MATYTLTTTDTEEVALDHALTIENARLANFGSPPLTLADFVQQELTARLGDRVNQYDAFKNSTIIEEYKKADDTKKIAIEDAAGVSLTPKK